MTPEERRHLAKQARTEAARIRELNKEIARTRSKIAEARKVLVASEQVSKDIDATLEHSRRIRERAIPILRRAGFLK